MLVILMVYFNWTPEFRVTLPLFSSFYSLSQLWTFWQVSWYRSKNISQWIFTAVPDKKSREPESLLWLYCPWLWWFHYSVLLWRRWSWCATDKLSKKFWCTRGCKILHSPFILPRNRLVSNFLRLSWILVQERVIYILPWFII